MTECDVIDRRNRKKTIHDAILTLKVLLIQKYSEYEKLFRNVNYEKSVYEPIRSSMEVVNTKCTATAAQTEGKW